MKKPRVHENKTERVKRYLENGILDDKDIAAACGVTPHYVDQTRKALKARRIRLAREYVG